MVTYTDCLYQNIFEKNAAEFTHLRIISGYGSSKFLSKVIEQFPHLNIQLFLGMTAEGVSIDNHNAYLLMCRQSDKIRVFYQIEGALNHMKILEFSNDWQKKTFVGSANFTENGFIYQRELMTEIQETLDDLFVEQLNRSLSCTEQNIANFIKFYVGLQKPFEQPKNTEDDTIKNSGEIVETALNAIAATTNKSNTIIPYNKLIMLRKKIDLDYYNKFKLPIVRHSSNNHRWASTGINAWMEGKKVVLEQPSSVAFNNVFPNIEEFKVYTDNDLIFRAKLTGKFNRQLQFIDIDLYHYIVKRLDLEEGKPICYEDLLSKNQTTLYFERINFSEFYMSFSEI